MLRNRKIMVYGCGIILLLVLFVSDLLSGDSSVSLLHPSDAQKLIFWKLRLPRALAALLGGAALSLSGLQMQAVFRNPLADPHIMGVSAGASLAAAFVTAALPNALNTGALSGLSLAAAAFLASAVVTLLILALSARIDNANALLIFGVMVGYVLSACTSIIEYSSSDKALRLFYNWSAGSFSSVSWPQLAIMASMIAIGIIVCCRNLHGLDLLLFGDSFALSVGADVKRVRAAAMLSTCLLSSAVTAFCGPLGFVGIAGPHIARWAWGSSVHGRVLPGSLIAGSSIALIADLLSVNLPVAIPVGSAMAVVGLPVVFIIILRSLRGNE